VVGPWTGKLKNEGERLTVRDKNGVTLCTVKYSTCDPWPTADEEGRSLKLIDPNQRIDDGRNWAVSPSRDVATARSCLPRSPRLPAAASATPGTDVVINEIMFDPPSHLALSEYVELFNRGPRDIDLSGWQLSGGIHFRFPEETKIAAGGFLVVAQDADRLRAIHESVAVLGNFEGKLRNGGELIRLLDRAGHVANEVEFAAGGDWPELPRGGGSSLELLNPWMDNRLPSAWRASDESDKAPLRSYTATTLYRQANPHGDPSDFKELHLHLVGHGHVVLENIALLNGGTNYIPHGDRLSTNGSGATGWLCQGTHAASFVTNGQLHLVADGRGDDRANRVEIDLPGLEPGQTYELKFNARWVSGKPRLIAQTWDRSLVRSYLLEMPTHLGTPGRTNSQARRLPAPQIDALQHHPAVPRSGERVTMTARVTARTPGTVVELWHRPDRAEAEPAWQRQLMRDDGTQGDAIAGDGIYTAELDAYRTNGQVVAFFAQAVAADGQRSASPNGAADRPALFVVDDRPLPAGLRIVRWVLSARDLKAMADGNTAQFQFHYPRLSNHRFNATFISEERDIFYNAEIRNCGSPLTREGDLDRVKIKLPADRPFRGHTELGYDDDAAEGKAYHNRVTRYLLYRLGHPVNENEFVRTVLNAGPIQLKEETEPVGNEFLSRNFAHGRQGDLYRIDDDWQFLDNWEGDMHQADWFYKGEDAGAYRSQWMKRTRETEDDYSQLIAFFKAVSATNWTESEIAQRLDPEATLKVAAVRGLIGDWDSFTLQRGRNCYFYRRPSDGRFQFLHWDSDEAFVTGQPLYSPRVQAWLEKPGHEQLFYGYVLELLTITWREPAQFRAWLEAEREATGDAVQQATYLNFFRVRAAELLQDIASRKRASLAPQVSGEEKLRAGATAVATNCPASGH
jgi:hypothetical protein